MSLYPKSYRTTQGKRPRDRWGPCRECGWPGRFVCRRCSSWRCGICVVFRAAPGQPGTYHATCTPKCRARMTTSTAEHVRTLTRKGGR
jgi:hypothetical protein